MMLRCFFFQAEDGIRDGRVTGVQTCALPISPASPSTAELQNQLRKTRTLLVFLFVALLGLGVCVIACLVLLIKTGDRADIKALKDWGFNVEKSAAEIQTLRDEAKAEINSEVAAA